MIVESKAKVLPVTIKLEWPVAACTQCAGELERVAEYESNLSGNHIHSTCTSCGHWEYKLVTKYLQGTVCPM